MTVIGMHQKVAEVIARHAEYTDPTQVVIDIVLSNVSGVVYSEISRALDAQKDHDPTTHAHSRCVGGVGAGYVILDAIQALHLIKGDEDK